MAENKKAKPEESNTVQIGLRISKEAHAKLMEEQAAVAKQFKGVQVPLSAIAAGKLEHSLGVTR